MAWPYIHVMLSPRQSATLRPLGLNFDSFLYAQVGDDQQGGLLSVVSALARVGVDPWEQAAVLARLPLDVAARALAALLAKLPAGKGKPVDPIQVATQLVALLPHGSPTATAASSTASVASKTRNAPNRPLIALLCVVFLLLLLLGSELLIRR